MPGRERLREVAGQTVNHTLLVVIEGAEHAVNFSHPDELANVVRLFMADRRIVDDPDAPGVARTHGVGPRHADPTRVTGALNTLVQRRTAAYLPDHDRSSHPRSARRPS
jgi:hypothetical protein